MSAFWVWWASLGHCAIHRTSRSPALRPENIVEGWGLERRVSNETEDPGWRESTGGDPSGFWNEDVLLVRSHAFLFQNCV